MTTPRNCCRSVYLGRHGQILAAHKDLGVSSVKELVDYVKKNPGLGLATSGVGSNQHVLCEWFAKEAGIKLEHVPYRGAGQAINDLIAAHVKIAMLGPTVDDAALRRPARSSCWRSRWASAVRCCRKFRRFEEAGYKGLVLEAWYAAFVPKGDAQGDRRQAQRRDEQGAEGSEADRDLHQGRDRARSAARRTRSASSRRPTRRSTRG